MKKVFLASICLMLTMGAMSQDLLFNSIKRYDENVYLTLSTMFLNEPVYVVGNYEYNNGLQHAEIYDKELNKIFEFFPNGIEVPIFNGTCWDVKHYVTQNLFNDDNLFEYITTENNNIVIKNENDIVLGTIIIPDSATDVHCGIVILEEETHMHIHYQLEHNEITEIYEITTQSGETNIMSFTKNTSKAYPNPATTHIFIDNDNLSTGIINVFNEHGKLVKQQNITSDDKIMVETTNLSSGFYIYSIQEGNSIKQSGKFIVR